MSSIILFGRLQGVYGSNDDVKRKYLWDELVGLMSWVILMLFVSQVKDQVTPNNHQLCWISKFIFEQGLMDIPIVGGNLSWSNNRDL